MEPGFSVQQAALPGAVPALRAAVSRFLEPANLPSAQTADILLAVTEACANVVQHAYPEGEGDMLVEASLSDAEVIARVADWGCPFADGSREPGLGMGVPLIHHLADHVDLSVANGIKRVEMRFARSGRRQLAV